MKFAVTYPVALLAVGLAAVFAAVLIVAIVENADLAALLSGLGAFLTAVLGVWAHRSVTPVARPQNDSGQPLTPPGQ